MLGFSDVWRMRSATSEDIVLLSMASKGMHGLRDVSICPPSASKVVQQAAVSGYPRTLEDMADHAPNIQRIRILDGSWRGSQLADVLEWCASSSWGNRLACVEVVSQRLAEAAWHTFLAAAPSLADLDIRGCKGSAISGRSSADYLAATAALQSRGLRSLDALAASLSYQRLLPLVGATCGPGGKSSARAGTGANGASTEMRE